MIQQNITELNIIEWSRIEYDIMGCGTLKYDITL